MGNVATKGAPTTAQTSSRLSDPVEGLPTVNGIQSGGIMMLLNPSLQSRIMHTTHRCSGRLFMVHLRHNEEDLIIVALYGVSAPKTDDKKLMRAQLAEALTQIAQKYDGKPLMMIGDYNAAASPEDRGTGKLLPYGTVPDAVTIVLTRLSLIDVHRQKFPKSHHYT